MYNIQYQFNIYTTLYISLIIYIYNIHYIIILVKATAKTHRRVGCSDSLTARIRLVLLSLSDRRKQQSRVGRNLTRKATVFVTIVLYCCFTNYFQFDSYFEFFCDDILCAKILPTFQNSKRLVNLFVWQRSCL